MFFRFYELIHELFVGSKKWSQLTDELDETIDNLVAKIERVQKLHKPEDVLISPIFGPMKIHCDYCDERYPCRTVKALDGVD